MQLRDGQQYQEAEAKQGELIGEGDAAYKKAIGSWEDEELDQSKHWALLASIKVRTALTIIAQEGAKQRITLAKKKLGEMKAIQAQLVEKDRETDEQLRLHGEIKAAKKSAAAKEAALKEKEAALKQKLTEAQKEKAQQAKLAAAQKVISDAAVALKKAETVPNQPAWNPIPRRCNRRNRDLGPWMEPILGHSMERPLIRLTHRLN